jgi:hypothetical protein
MFWSLRHKKSLSYCMAWILIFCVRRALLFLLFHTFVELQCCENYTTCYLRVALCEGPIVELQKLCI